MIKEVIWTYNLLGMIWEGTYIVRTTFNRFMTWSIYGIRRQLIDVGSITEVEQRRAQFIIGWVTAWGIRKVRHRACQVLYTLVGLGEPRKSDGSSDWPRVGRKRTSMDVGAASIRRDPGKSTMCEYLATYDEFAWNENSLMRLNGSSAVYLPGDGVGIWIITDLAKLLCALKSIEIRRNINAIKIIIIIIMVVL